MTRHAQTNCPACAKPSRRMKHICRRGKGSPPKENNDNDAAADPEEVRLHKLPLHLCIAAPLHLCTSLLISF